MPSSTYNLGITFLKIEYLKTKHFVDSKGNNQITFYNFNELFAMKYKP